MTAPHLQPVEYRNSRVASGGAIVLLSIVAVPGALLVPFGLWMLAHPAGRTFSDSFQAFIGIPIGAWMAWSTWAYLRRAIPEFIRPTVAVRLDSAGITVTDKESRLFRWAEDPKFRFSRGASGGFIDVRSRDGFSARVGRLDVDVTLEELHKRLAAFRKAYGGAGENADASKEG